MTLPSDYVERVYAGVLGKIIGVYLGRPFEGWKYRDILAKLGPIQYYVNEKLNQPLIVSDDDISGTFTFIRALEDYAAAGKNITAKQIGQTWLNYIIENRTILWWGGMGMSTEHTAYLRLKHGIAAPDSGSMKCNGKVVSEQIGAQIFIDGFAMVAPGDPELAAALAHKAASVSHDGEAIYGAQVIASMGAQAFVEKDIDTLLDVGVSFIPKDSVIFRMIDELRDFREKNDDWNAAMTDVMEKSYGYDKFGGNCHMVPNHGLITLALLYGDDDFQKSLMIVNTCGWDTDCNSANVGCLMGIKNGLAGIDAGPDWRGPVADRLLLPTADGGACLNDAVTQAYRIANMGRALAGESPLAPKNGAKFHFSLPGSVQGWVVEDSAESRDVTRIYPSAPNSRGSDHALGIAYRHLAPGRFARAAVATFVTPAQAKMGGYSVIASPTMYSGQVLRASIFNKALPDIPSLPDENSAERIERFFGESPVVTRAQYILDGDLTAEPIHCRPYLHHYGDNDSLVRVYGPSTKLASRESHELTWTIPDTNGLPIVEIGFEITAAARVTGSLRVDWLTWDGSPTITLKKNQSVPMTRRAWVDGADHFQHWGGGEDDYVIIQDHGRGLVSQGTRDWHDYTATCGIQPHMADMFGLAIRVQGMQRYYALLLTDDNGVRMAKLVRVLDGETVLAETPLNWVGDSAKRYEIRLTAKGEKITATIDGKTTLEANDAMLTGGAAGMITEVGRVAFGPIKIEPS